MAGFLRDDPFQETFLVGCAVFFVQNVVVNGGGVGVAHILEVVRTDDNPFRIDVFVRLAVGVNVGEFIILLSIRENHKAFLDFRYCQKAAAAYTDKICFHIM